MKVTWSDEGQRTAGLARAFIARDRPDVAADWLEELGKHASSLARFPNRGRIVPELGLADYREIIIAPYRIIYRIEPARVLILTVWHGRRPLDATALTGSA